MHVKLQVLLLSLLLTAACGSSLNPMNWFGDDAPDESVLDPVSANNPLLPSDDGPFARRTGPSPYLGTPVEAVTDLTLERVPGGLIIRATGRSSSPGIYDARLVSENEDGLPVEGVLTYSLRALKAQTGGVVQPQDVTVARQLTNQELAGARTIRVEGQQNTLERRR
jgi:hypothetical protein